MLLTMIGMVLIISARRTRQSAIRWRDLAILMLAGLTIAMIDVSAIDVVRMALTHTWSGFPSSILKACPGIYRVRFLCPDAW